MKYKICSNCGKVDISPYVKCPYCGTYYDLSVGTIKRNQLTDRNKK